MKLNRKLDIKKYDFKIWKKIITENSKTYFIADIGANHDGSLLRAKN